MITHLGYRMQHLPLLGLLALGTFGQQNSPGGATSKQVSQCHRPGQLSFVSLYCGSGAVIQIQSAFHGAHRNPALTHCGELPTDCTVDSVHAYDWTRCEGHSSCVQVIQAQEMDDECGGETLYLQVHYTCVPGSPTSTTVVPSTRLDTASTTTAEEQHSICTNFSSDHESHLQVTSPGFPLSYPTSTECRCLIKAQAQAKVKVTYADLTLLMRSKQCVDWLLLQSLGFKNSAAVTCGQMTGDQEKTLTAKGNHLLLHFHTAKMTAGNESRKMKGFRVKISSEPPGKLDVQCYKTSSAVLASLQYKSTQADANDNIILPQSDLNAIAKPSTAKNRALKAVPSWILLLITFMRLASE